MQSVRLLVTALILVFAAGASAQRASLLGSDSDTEGPALRAVFEPVVAAVRDSVVEVIAEGRQVALGAVVSADGGVVTKASEVAGHDAVRCRLPDGREVDATPLAVDRSSDIALLQLDAEGLTPVTWAEAPELTLGQWVVTPGSGELPVAVGVLSALPRKVAGVRLGLQLFDSETRGVFVSGTLPGMGAEVAGVRPGDRIVTLADRPIRTFDDILKTLEGFNAGDRVELVAERQEQVVAFEVELRLRPVDPSNRADSMNTAGNELSQRRDGFERVFQHDATINPGECGGPIVDLDGQVIGLNIARAGRVEAYAIAADDVRAVVERLQSETHVRQDAAAVTR